MIIFKRSHIICFLLWMTAYVIYYNNNFTILYAFANKTHVQISEENIRVYNHSFKGSERYLINTPGCYIPNYSRTFKFKETNYMNRSCGVRAVVINKMPNEHIELKIDKLKMDIYSHGKTFRCCVQFASSVNVSGKIDLKTLEVWIPVGITWLVATNLVPISRKTAVKDLEQSNALCSRYSLCTPFQNGSRLHLEQEIVVVSCYSKLTKIYEDVYFLLKKVITSKDKKKANTNAWNVLILGMDTMSRARLFSSMPRTAQFLREHNWLDFRGYQKVGYNTFPNVLALMTGKNVTTIYKDCEHGLDKCSKFLIWNKFKRDGYVTAYGEDYLRLPDTFSKFNGFTVSPTDHYMRPFFLTGEVINGNYVCAKKLSSAHHLLDSAYQFADAYKKYKHYGMFWINSCSHNLNNLPTLYDQDFVSFFTKLHENSLMTNTFVMFLSDHGIRYGSMRVPVESYYEERLPMLWVWVPMTFRERFARQYTNMLLNQERLVTPYDLYLTMADILRMGQSSNEVTTSEACPLCKSLFRIVSDHRTCSDAGVEEKWCTCHNMSVVDKNKADVVRSLQTAIAYLEKRTKDTKTAACTQCEKFKLKTILRSHSYEIPEQNKLYYVVAFVMDPGDVSYEAIVLKYKNEFSIAGKMETITPYNPRGNCVKNPNDRGYCVCKKLNNCKNNI